jgi:excisionase family DNA binding protein
MSQKMVRDSVAIPNMDAYLSIDEVSSILNIKKPTLYQWVESRQIPHYKMGKLIRFKRDEVIQWMDEHKVAPVDLSKRTREIVKKINHRPKNMKNLIKKTLDGLKTRHYNSEAENQPIAEEGGEYDLSA